MRKISLLGAFAMLFSWQASAQVSVGSGTTVTPSGQSIPIEPYYGYSYSQIIYTATEINASGNITGVKFYATSATTLANSSNWTVYVGHTTKANFTSTTDWIDVSTLTQAFTGTVTISGGEVQVTFSTPFSYNGTDNLVIAVDENTASYDASSHDFYCTATAGTRAILYRHDGTNPDPTSPPTASHTLNYISNIQIQGITQSCPTPSALSISNLTATSVDLGWTENGSATTWNVEYGATGFTQGTGTTIATTTNPHSLSGLTANTSYDFYVQADCGGGDLSTWVGPFTFSTLCNAFAVPFTEDFSSTSSSKSCWTVNNANADTDEWNLSYTSNPHVGDQVATIYTDYNSGNNDDYLISPAITLTGNERLKFHERAQSTGEPNDYRVLISTTGTAPADFSTVLLTDTANTTTYDEHIIDLSSYTGNVYIAFHIPSGSLDGWRLYIDNVIVEAIPCAPTTGTDVQTACNSYTWIDGVTYTASNNTATDTLTNAAGCDSIVTLDLTIAPLTLVYDTTVVSQCSDYTWAQNSMTYNATGMYNDTVQSGAGCDSAVMVLDLTINTLNVATSVSGLTITADLTGATYQWINCSDSSVIAGETAQSFTATANGDYAVIITDGSCTDTSACVAINSVSIEENTISFSIHPNPTNGEVNIVTDVAVSNVEIFSATGQKVMESKATTLNISDVQSGVYFVKVHTEQGTSTQRIIKE